MSIDPKALSDPKPPVDALKERTTATPGDGLVPANALGEARSMDQPKGVQVAQWAPPVTPPTIAWDVGVAIGLGITWMAAKNSQGGKTSAPSSAPSTNVQVVTPPPQDEEPKKKKKVKQSETGEKVRTPDSHPDDFTKLRNGQGYLNNETGETWQASNTSHKGDVWKVFDSSGSRVGSIRPDGTIAGK